MKRISLSFLLLLPLMVMANGDPVAEYCALTLSKAPVSCAIPEIQIEREDLNIELMDGCSHIRVEYVLHNTSNKRFKNIHYGFPVDWEGEGNAHWTGDLRSESLYQKGWSDDYVTDFSFYLNEKHLPAQMSGDTLLRPIYTSGDWHKKFGYPDWRVIPDSIIEDDNNRYAMILSEHEWTGKYTDSLILEEPLYRRWYYTSFSIRPHATVKLRVEYTLRHPHSVGLSSLVREFQNYHESHQYHDQSSDNTEHHNYTMNTFIYDYSPAAAWGNGKVEELNLNIKADSKVVVYSPEYHYKASPLFVGNYQKQYKDFDYATAEPLRLQYYHLRPDSLDVIAIREHRLPADDYKILSLNNDTNNYAALSDLSACTGVALTPTDSGNYVLDIILDEPAHITGLAIMNGNCCDSLSWVTNGRIEQMQVMYWGRTPWDEKYKWMMLYGKKKWIVKYIQYEMYPTDCKTDIPTSFTWGGLVKAAEKMNVLTRYLPFFSTLYEYNPIQHIRIIIPQQERDPYISEVILLYDQHEN